MITIILLLGCAYATSPFKLKHSVHRNVARGAFGDDVIELQRDFSILVIIQGRLMGNSVMELIGHCVIFKRNMDLPVDGIAGLKTKKKLVEFHSTMRNL